MYKNIPNAIAEHFSDYKRLANEAEYFSAIVCLGEILNCIRHQRVSKDLEQRCKQTIAEEEISDANVEIAISQLHERLARIRRILEIGNEFTYEEILLVLTMRIQVDLALEFLASRAWDLSEVDVGLIDEKLEELATEPSVSDLIRSAMSNAKRNWGIPLEHRWLG